MPTSDVVLVDVIQSVIGAMIVANPAGGNFTMNYEPGRSFDIIKSLGADDNSITYKGVKYPLFAMLMPIREKKGEFGFAGRVVIPRIVIATLTKTVTGEEPILNKYDSAGTFKTILYPLYNEFLKRLAASPNVSGSDPNAFIHEKMDNPGQQVEQSTTDYIDSIEILNLELILLNIKTC